jgi:hypothetical protein
MIENENTGELTIREQADTTVFIGIAAGRVSEAEEAILRAQPSPEELDVKPTGEAYLPANGYRRILLNTFGPGGWGQRPLRDPLLQDNYVYQPYALYIRGNYVSAATGECEYQPTNTRMSYGDAVEGARSNALMRCCKDLGVAACCWDRSFQEDFRRKYCEEYRDDRGKLRWRKKLLVRPDDRADDNTRQKFLLEATERLGGRQQALEWISATLAELGIAKGTMTYAQLAELRGRLNNGGLG